MVVDEAAPGSDIETPHVVMLVSNDISSDTRVKKEALAVASLGLRVTLVGSSPDATRRVSRMGDVDVIRVPVTDDVRDAMLQSKQRRRSLPLVTWPSETHRRAAEVFAQYRSREIQAASGNDVARRDSGDITSAAYLAAVGRRRMALATLGLRRRLIQARTESTRKVSEAFIRWDSFNGRRAERVKWQRQIPGQMERELAFGPEIDRLEPDIIHAHDADMMGVATFAVSRAQLRGRRVAWVYDAHEFVAGLSPSLARTPRVIAAWAAYEDEFIRGADQVVTVSPQMSEAIKHRYGLDSDPWVVLNTPVVPSGDPPRSIRADVGLSADTPLLVYTGIVTPARGIDTALEALTRVPEAHLALVCVPHPQTWYIRTLRQKAQALGLGDRAHFLDPVAPDDVVRYISSADIGIFSGLRYPSHDVTLANKLFEYMYAGLPLVVSDLRAQQELVVSEGIGAVFAVGDANEMADAIRHVLADLDTYRTRVTSPDLLGAYSWERQEDVICDLYSELTGVPLQRRESLVRSLSEVTV